MSYATKRREPPVHVIVLIAVPGSGDALEHLVAKPLSLSRGDFAMWQDGHVECRRGGRRSGGGRSVLGGPGCDPNKEPALDVRAGHADFGFVLCCPP